MHALMMISMVRSVDQQTKLLCIIALSNLLDENTIDYMLDEGLVGSVAQISKMPDTRTIHLCGTLLNRLSFYPAARIKMAEKGMVLHALFAMIDAERNDTRIMAARTTSNLILCMQVRKRTIAAGGLRALEAGIISGDPDASLHCLKALFSAAAETSFLTVIASSSLPMALSEFATGCTDEKHELAVKILSLLAWNIESRVYLQTKEFAEVFIALIIKNLIKSSSKWIALTLRYLTLGYRRSKELLDADIVDALKALFKIAEDSSNIYANIVEVIRCIAETKGCEESLATPNTIVMIGKAAEICTEDAKTMYHISVILYSFSSCSNETRMETSSPETEKIFVLLNNYKECIEIITASICQYLSDAKTRSIYASKEIAAIVIGVISSNPSTDLLSNAISCIFALSKRALCREFLVEAPLNADMHLLKLSQSEDPKIKANCARTLKNMTSDSTEALEEGAVANLIAMSLEGKEKTIFQEEISVPVFSPPTLKDLTPPECISDPLTEALWYETKVVVAGGAAGKGPDSPEPPSMSVDGSSQYPSMMEEQDSGESEGKTKMAFAKMQTPQSLRESYLLTDADFETIREGEDQSVADVGLDPEVGEESNGDDVPRLTSRSSLREDDEDREEDIRLTSREDEDDTVPLIIGELKGNLNKNKNLKSGIKISKIEKKKVKPKGGTGTPPFNEGPEAVKESPKVRITKGGGQDAMVIGEKAATLGLYA